MLDLTPATFKARYPKFASVPDATVDVFLKDAAGVIDGGDWTEADRGKAAFLLTAHNLATEGLGSSADAQFGAFKRLKIGSLELERDNSAASSTTNPMGSTEYGRQYLALARLNFSGVMVV